MSLFVVSILQIARYVVNWSTVYKICYVRTAFLMIFYYTFNNVEV